MVIKNSPIDAKAKYVIVFFNLLLFWLFFTLSSLKAQTDTKFWYVVPEVTINHNYPGGVSSYFKFSAGLNPAVITISMPANRYSPSNPNGFPDIVLDTIYPISDPNPLHKHFIAEDVSQWIVSPYPWSTQGVLFSINPTTFAYTKKFNFTGSAGANQGQNPYGSLIAGGTTLYGTTRQRGSNNNPGVVFKYNFSTNAYSKTDLDGTGSFPYGSLVAVGAKMFGMTREGGANNRGAIFDYDPATNAINRRFSFTHTAALRTGSYPYGSLVAIGTTLYGMTRDGGANNLGVLFDISSNAPYTFNKRVDFSGVANGQNPFGSLVEFGGKLYGMTSGGGANGCGVLFEFTPPNTFTKKIDFTGVGGAAPGRNPYGSLIVVGGTLYGMTSKGGANDMGVIFQYVPGATSITIKHEFSVAADGKNPYGTLMQASDGNLYGMTCYGGAYNLGTIFRFNPGTSAYSKMHDFTGNNNGNNPYFGQLIQASDGNLYGLALGLAPYPGVDDNDVFGLGKLTIENKPLTSDGINNVGIKITSNNLITCYYETSNSNNKDIWALKGSNALGTEFFTPFQTHNVNQTLTNNAQMEPFLPSLVQPYSSIDVVATEDFTTVTFDLPPGVRASYGTSPSDIVAGGSYPVNLMAGQTFSLFPYHQSQAVADRLGGTKVTSNLPIAVTLKDDSFKHSSGGCYDVAGDQIVPTDIIGKEYAVIRTFLDNWDHIYILGTVNGTSLKIYNTVGTLITNTTINLGQQLYVKIPDGETYYRIVCDQPVYVWHVGGFGCEQGGAILPPIDKCTGSTQVSFARTSTEDFFVIMMVRKGAEGGFKFDGVVNNALFDSLAFTPISGSNWSVARFGTFNTTQIAVGSHFMENTKDIFHLGIVNGGGGSGCFYGYFSDFNELKVNAVVAGTSSGVLKTCYGNPVQLFATGGTNFLWSPDSTLSDPTIQNPWATPKSNTPYQVVVSGACDMTDTAFIDVQVSTPLNATFISNKISGCAPLIVDFEDKSSGIKYWQYDFGDGSPYLTYDLDALTADPPPPVPFTFSHTFNNNTNDTIVYKVVLLAKNQDGCADVYYKFITVLPSINANFTQDITQGCNPQTVTFTNSSSSNTLDSYLWDFGDGFSDVTNNPTGTVVHNFNNLVPRDSIYTVTMTATSPHGCKSTATSTVEIYSFFDAGFTIDVASGCSPLTVNISNTSVGDTASYRWTLDGVLFKTTGLDTTITLTNNASNTFKDFIIQLQVFNQGDKCSKTVSNTIRVYPRVTAGFTIPAPAAFCNLTNVSFTNTTTPVSTNPGGVANVYDWNFGDGANSSALSPSHIYDNQTSLSRNYRVKLTARNQFGCQDTISKLVKIYSEIYADFAAIQKHYCSPDTVIIDNNSRGGIASYLWNYGDATTSGTNLDHTHPYTNNGLIPITRTINLTVTNEGGCTSLESHDVLIYPSVTASFTPNVNAGCNPVSLTLDNTSKANATIYNWSFGDGNTSVDFEPSHTLNNLTGVDKTYKVKLTVFTDFGCTASDSVNITVYPFIDAQFAIDTSYGCSPLDVWFSYNKYLGITEYRWDWNGGGTDAITLPANPPQIFHQFINQTGLVQNLNPRLTVVNHANCSDYIELPVSVYPEVKAAFNPNITMGCNPLTVNYTNNSIFTGTINPLVNTNYYWSYGDGGSSIDKNPTHQFFNDDALNNVVYSTQLKVVSEFGCSDSIKQDIEVYNRVESHFTMEHASNCTPFEVTFKPSAIGAAIYNWDYDAALPPESFLVDNPFTRQFTNLDPNLPVTYTIKLEVKNNEGCPAVSTRDLEVYPLVDADFVPTGSTIGCSDMNVTFDNISFGSNLVYLWDFGNGQSAVTFNKSDDVTQLFTNRGSVDSIYHVKLMTINPNGCIDSLIVDVTVYPKVEAGFVFAQQSQCTPFNLDLTNTSLNGDRFFWSTIYNGSILKLDKTSFPYLIDNTTDNSILLDTIKLVTLDNRTGCIDSISKPITIYPRIRTLFDVDTDKGCNPLSVTITNNSKGLGTPLWEFGDGGTSAVGTPAPHIYSHPYKDQEQFYTLKLTNTNSFGCKSVKDTLLTVYPLVKADFQWDKFEGCTPLTVTLNNSSLSPRYNYRWDFGDGSPRITNPQPGTHEYINTTNNTNLPLLVQTPIITLVTSYINDATCIDSTKLSVNVFPHVYPNFNFSDSVGCHPLLTDLINKTLSFNNSTTNYSWNLGNGTYSNLTNLTNQLYKNNSVTKDTTYSIKLIARSVHQCVDSVSKSVIVHPKPIASYVMNNESVSCSPFLVTLNNLSRGQEPLSYSFDMDDGTIYTPLNKSDIINHTYHNTTTDNKDYTITLTTTTSFGCSHSTSQTVYAYPEVKAKFEVDNQTGCSPLMVNFTSSGQNGYFYQWNFKDGTNSNLMSPSHRFVNATETDKVFDVYLKSISAYDCTDDTIVPVTVYATPVANFGINPPFKIFPDATFNFSNQSAPAANGWTYLWDFGDGFTSNLKNPNDHTYLKWGPNSNDNIYTVSLRIDAPHCSSNTSNILRLLPAVPIPFFTSNIDSSCSPLEVHFVNASQFGKNYVWDFDDESFSNEAEPIHTFIKPGYYVVKLSVDGDGGTSYYYKTYRVFQNPIASYKVFPYEVMLPDAQVHFYNLTQFGESYLWKFGDGAESNEKDPVHKYTELGAYGVTLTAYSPEGCVDDTSHYPSVWVRGIGSIEFPNAFVPNKSGPNGGLYDDVDYKNEVFHPAHQGVIEYKLMIFNRWGEQLFESTNIKVGWDGYYKGKLSDQGVYIWRAIGKFTNGKSFDKKGNVTLLR